MKKGFLCFLISICMFLVACGAEEFSYDKELNLLIDSYNEGGDCFSSDLFEEKLGTTSNSYRTLVTAIYKDSSAVLLQSDGNSVSCGIIYFDYEDAFQRITSDTTGFVHDVQNLYDLNIAQSEINEYVYDYMYLMILSCNKKQHTVECSLTQSNAAPFRFVDNENIVNQIIIDINQLVYDCENYAKEYTETAATKTDAEEYEFKYLDLDKTQVLNYACDTEVAQISLTVKTVMFGNEAKEKALSLSTNNSKLICDNLAYIEYEIHNYSASDIVFTSRFYDCDANSLNLYTDNISFVGINKSCNIAAGSTIMVNDLIIINHDDLAWYDKNAGELYLLNQK